ncbi:MAG: hypothetical protein ACXWP5_12285 [Bdellovibrionota bacterium]
MISLREKIDCFFDGFQHTNPFFAQARSGVVTRDQVAAYVQSLHYLFLASTRLSSLAEREARARRQDALAAFFSNKTHEETGHEKWAEEDLKSMDRPEQKVCRTIVAQVDYLEKLIKEDPGSFLGYIFFAEYVTVRGGPTLLRLLEENCGIPSAHFTAVGKHVEADQHHVKEDLQEIERILGENGHKRAVSERAIRTVVDQAMQFFGDFCGEIAGLHAGH